MDIQLSDDFYLASLKIMKQTIVKRYDLRVLYVINMIQQCDILLSKCVSDLVCENIKVIYLVSDYGFR